MPPPDPEHTAVFAVLQSYNRLGLLVPVDAEHMWHAAMQSKSCRLTALGGLQTPRGEGAHLTSPAANVP